MCGGYRRPGSIASSATSALLAACMLTGLMAVPAPAQVTQSPSTINPANPQDRTLTNPQDMTAPNAVNPQNRRGPSNASPSTSTSPGYGSGLTGNLSDNYGGSLNQKLAGPIPPGSTTLQNALQQAYHNNPTLNAQRAATRVADENVPTALSGYRPRVTGTSSLTEQYLENLVKNQNSIAGPLACGRDLIGRSLCPTFPTYDKTQGATTVTSAGLTVNQTLFNGFQTANRTRLAEGQVFSARETLRTTEQTTLLNAVTAYMNLLRDASDPRTPAQQRERARSHAAPDSRSLQCRRGDAHRRCASGGPSVDRPFAARHRRIELHFVARHLSAGDRCSGAGKAGPGGARRSVLSAHAPRGHRARARANIRPLRQRCTTSMSRPSR